MLHSADGNFKLGNCPHLRRFNIGCGLGYNEGSTVSQGVDYRQNAAKAQMHKALRRWLSQESRGPRAVSVEFSELRGEELNSAADEILRR
jgi:hypothetical protein